ncbi:hypothetical protein [Glaciecola petra]|uniref:HMW1C N-terminal domain-containing protein n=1 Tax=Glaciecola petra TaxID=3075602 RepID=A0ABU2ZP81_9ALTE|nr:hypothetical protein [Aestuariibacter sp. P117]MDT0593858.1 hypothetical protein [Aestuariibacter sp. P117]
MEYSPQQLMQYIQQRQFSRAEEGIIAFIEMNANKRNFIKLALPAGGHTTSQVEYEQQCVNSIGAYANIIVQLFCHPQYPPSSKILDTFLFNKETLEFIFSLSAWKTTDPIIEKLSLLQETKLKKSQLSKRKLVRLNVLFSLICLTSKHNLPWPNLFDLAPRLACLTYLALLSQTISTLAPGKDEKFSDLLAQAKNLPVIKIDEFLANFALNGYFYSSYTTGENKYEIKKWLSKLLRANISNFLSKEICLHIESCTNKPIPQKPKIGIVLEVFHTHHAMYRCFNLSLRALAKQYTCIAFLDNDKTYEIDVSAFESAKYFELSDSINQRAQLISKEKCDVLFYPSVGLKSWGFVLASMRLAPLQFMQGGHPSSTYSDAMDYFIIPGNAFAKDDVQQYINEKVIMVDDKSSSQNYATRHSQLSDKFVRDKSGFLEEDKEIIIGVNGVIRKVSCETISLCKEISERASKPIKFIFFSMHPSAHLAYLETKVNLSSILPNIEIISYSEYLSYLEQISRCHFLLPTLPFGGANSNVDAMVLKKPKLYLNQRKELYTRTDAIEWQSIGLADLMRCDTKEEMIDKALGLIESKETRINYFKAMSEKCQLENIFGNNDSNDTTYINRHVELLLDDYQANLRLPMPTQEAC